MDIVGMQREIDDITLIAYIDIDLYRENALLFDCLFSTFSICSPLLNQENAMYIISSENICFFDPNVTNLIVCDTSNKNWGLQLIGALEDWYANTLNCTIIHGSCVLLNNKGVLIIGKRKAGKTTLTSYLTLKKDAVYLDDDCVYIVNKKCIGFNMPISVRNNIDDLNKENMMVEFIDGEKISRKLFRARFSLKEISKIDTIIFPCFFESEEGNIAPIERGELYKEILVNIRHSADSETMFMDICDLVKKSRAYQIKYNNSKMAYQLIESII